MNTIRLTMAQALVRFLDAQYLGVDGVEHKFVRGVFTIFGVILVNTRKQLPA